MLPFSPVFNFLSLSRALVKVNAAILPSIAPFIESYHPYRVYARLRSAASTIPGSAGYPVGHKLWVYNSAKGMMHRYVSKHWAWAPGRKAVVGRLTRVQIIISDRSSVQSIQLAHRLTGECLHSAPRGLPFQDKC